MRHFHSVHVAAVVSNDSDLLAPIQIVREELDKRVGLLIPHKRPSRALLPHTDFHKRIRAGALSRAQFPDELTDRTGTISRPVSWQPDQGGWGR